uniref:Signal recognition particle receptor subunit alpha n=1 Tax=Aceria tosichella TaxID=561515 RepID=A0A6G1SMC4_9ACAR
MLEFFVIFSKSGIVLFATVDHQLNQIINGLVKHVFLEERTGHYQTDQLQIKYLLDNEFELVYVVGYQKFLQLSYVDKFLSDIQLAFRDKYSDFDLRKILNISFNKQATKLRKILKQECNNEFGPSESMAQKSSKKHKRLDFCDLLIDETSILEFTKEFGSTYEKCVRTFNMQPKQETMRTFQDSAKSKKTIASMIVDSSAPAPTKPTLAKEPASEIVNKKPANENIAPSAGSAAANAFKPPANMLAKLASRTGDTKVTKKAKKDTSEKESSKKGKAARRWDLSGSNPDEFDFSKKPASQSGDCNENGNNNSASLNKNIASSLLPEDVETNLEITDSEESSDEEADAADLDDAKTAAKVSQSSFFGSIWKTISYNKTLTEEDLKPVLDQLRDHLTAKNVAAETAEELCKSVCRKLEGQNVNTWMNLKKFAREALQEAVLNILNPSRTINILREIQAKPKPPYVIVFCGVNGVGKSTNLAKIANWLINNKVKVLVVACDTFRAGAIEQLKTHVMALKSLHERGKNAPIKIELFEKGYGRDSAAIAMEAINYARNNQFNCVMVDTAGRMQDNEPLMRQLAKLIKINTPDLTLFVGEALVGNEAVDQLTKFNKSLLDCGCRVEGSSRSAIDGIVLTKFDTIDDQVGAAISMTYVTGQPIVFVGVGQTYRDLKQLDAKAVTRALMR